MEAPSRTSERRASVDTSTEEGRAFLQQRLALFGRWFLLVAVAFYVVGNFPIPAFTGWEFDWFQEFLGVKERLQIGLAATAAAMWLFTRGRQRSHTALRWVDQGASIAAGCQLAGMLFWEVYAHGRLDDVFAIELAATNLVIVRAVLVPSRMGRTLGVSAAALAPVAVAPLTALLARGDIAAPVVTEVAGTAAVWAVIAAASATAISRILFELRGQVRNVRRLGQYTLLAKIGEGGMGVVYRATHAMLRRPTAIKLLSPARSSQLDLRRFEREVRLTAKLTHANTVAIYDFGRTPEGIFYYAMELLDGINLEDLVAGDGAQPPGRVIHVLGQVCGALAEAHAAGLIHRDIKPANLMLGVRGGVHDVAKVLDFGLARPVDIDDRDAELSVAGTVVGTPHYLAPESIETPERTDGRSDLYAVGAVGYFLLCGVRVFEAKTAILVCSKHLVETPVPPSQRLGRPLPGDLEAIILQCLAKDPARRPQSAGELGQLLAGCADAGTWTEEKARAWWQAHHASNPQAPSGSGEGTIDIDLDHRGSS